MSSIKNEIVFFSKRIALSKYLTTTSIFVVCWIAYGESNERKEAPGLRWTNAVEKVLPGNLPLTRGRESLGGSRQSSGMTWGEHLSLIQTPQEYETRHPRILGGSDCAVFHLSVTFPILECF